jgi:hypothetical protein
MFSVLICSLLAAYPTFSLSAEIPHSVPEVAICADSTTTWDAWKDDESRMKWWLENGWEVIDGVKEGTERLVVDEALVVSRDDFNPLQINLAPREDKHSVWSIHGNQTLILFSLSRCETLYQRYLVNQSAVRAKNLKK